MQIIEGLIQGSPQWLAIRAKYLTASEAPAALGVSKYTSRSALLKQKTSGVAPEVGESKQRLFDRGHAVEAPAREMAEAIIGAELYPVTCTETVDGLELLTSMDGLTMDERIGFEHKLWSEGLAEQVRAGNLEPHYTVQLDQQLAVSGAEKILFMCSDGTPERMVWCWYAGSQDERAALIAGWKQFSADLAAYTPAATAEPAKADAMESLPAVSVRLDGALSVAGNLPTFAEALKAFIAKIPTKPATDNEFATVDAACKALKKAEETLDAAEAGALASITDVEAMRRAVADCRKLARDTRLAAEKLVERRKVEMKEQAVMAARRAMQEHVDALSDELAPIRVQLPAVDFALAIKGLRSIASMQDALDTELANGKIAADAQARVIRANRAALEAADAAGLFPDFAHVCTKPADDFANLIASRRAVAEQRLQAERDRIRAEEASRLEREAASQRQREAAEAQARADEAARLERQAAADLAAKNIAAQDSQQVLKAEASTPDATDRDAPAITSPSVGSMGAGKAADAAPSVAPAPEVRAFTPRAAAPAAEEPTLSLGRISGALGFTVTADLLARLGFTAHVVKAARLYRPSQFAAIKRALIEHIEATPDEVPLAA